MGPRPSFSPFLSFSRRFFFLSLFHLFPPPVPPLIHFPIPSFRPFRFISLSPFIFLVYAFTAFSFLSWGGCPKLALPRKRAEFSFSTCVSSQNNVSLLAGQIIYQVKDLNASSRRKTFDLASRANVQPHFCLTQCFFD